MGAGEGVAGQVQEPRWEAVVRVRAQWVERGELPVLTPGSKILFLFKLGALVGGLVWHLCCQMSQP